MSKSLKGNMMVGKKITSRFKKKFIKTHSKKIGMAPGSMVFVGEQKVDKARISLIEYDEDHIRAKELRTIEEVSPFKEKPTITWLNVDGLHDAEILQKIGQHFDIHPLVLEDILNTDQRPKIEIYDDYLFIVFKMISNGGEQELNIEQVNIILGDNYVITFQERIGDVFDPIQKRINDVKGRLRKRGSDYLAYLLLDLIVDHYFLVLENIGETIEYLEDVVLSSPNQDIVTKIHHLKRELVFMRRSVWPLREVINVLLREECPFIQEATEPYLRDLYDHTIQVIDTVENYRDMAAGILDVYLSNVSNRMNQVMKVLTIIATIFIPLTFIAGIYGMNFDYMPELHWHWGYPVIWLIMLGIAFVMILYFRKKHWM